MVVPLGLNFRVLTLKLVGVWKFRSFTVILNLHKSMSCRDIKPQISSDLMFLKFSWKPDRVFHITVSTKLILLTCMRPLDRYLRRDQLTVQNIGCNEVCHVTWLLS